MRGLAGLWVVPFTYQERLLYGILKRKCLRFVSYGIFILTRFILVKYSRFATGTSSLASRLTTVSLDPTVVLGNI